MADDALHLLVDEGAGLVLRDAVSTMAAVLPSASQSDAVSGTATTGLMNPDLTRRAILALAPGATVTVGGVTAAYISKIGYGQVPVLDMFGSYRDGVNGDEPLINNILNGHNACVVKPGGPVFVKNSPILVPTNGRFAFEGGRQRGQITRPNGYTGDTLQMGSPTTGMGTAEVTDFWFLQSGRLIGAVPASMTTLPGLLTETTPFTGAAHIRAYGAQGGRIRCWLTGMPYGILQHGGDGLMIDNVEYFGGVWDRTKPGLQESIAVLATIWDPVHGHVAKTVVRDPNWIGGNGSAEVRAIPLHGKTYNSTERIGPKYGWLHACGEACQMIGGFTGGFNRSNIAILPGGPTFINGTPAWVQIRFTLANSNVDESMWAGIEANRSSASQSPMNRLGLFNNDFHGQTVGAHGLDLDATRGLYSVSRLKMSGNRLVGYQGGAARLYSVDGSDVSDTRIEGFNIAGFNTATGDPLDYGTGLIIGADTRNTAVRDLVGNGGVNADTDANNAQWLFADTTSGQGNTYRGVRSRNLGLAGGGTSAGGTNDTGN